MKKLILSIVVIALILGGGFFWLLSQTGADRAPENTVIIDLTDRVLD